MGGVKTSGAGYRLIMIQPVPPVADDPRPAVPAPRTGEPRAAREPETFTFVDVEHEVLEDAELEAVLAAWDGFL
jgi:hypothetical protein